MGYVLFQIVLVLISVCYYGNTLAFTVSPSTAFHSPLFIRQHQQQSISTTTTASSSAAASSIKKNLHRHPTRSPYSADSSALYSTLESSFDRGRTNAVESSNKSQDDDDDDQKDDPEDEVGAWIPIHSKRALRGLGPQQIRVMGLDLVVWKDEIHKHWSVMVDACPHRLAPLSQGRVDPETGCIECGIESRQW